MYSKIQSKFGSICLAMMWTLGLIIMLVSSKDNSNPDEMLVSTEEPTELDTQSEVYTEKSLDVLSSGNSQIFSEMETLELDVDTCPPPYILETEALQEPINATSISLNEDEMITFARLLFLEGGCESTQCQEAIASVIVNRMKLYDMSLYDVIYEADQFEPAPFIYSTHIDESDINDMLAVITKILAYGPTIPEYVTYFRANYYHGWSDRLIPYVNYDNTYFSYDIDVYNRYNQ